jgi:hypothetical protein
MLKEWIKNNCFSKKGSLNNRISLISWWNNKKFDNFLEEIINETKNIETDNITQRIYHIINDIKEIPLCKHCGINHPRFKQFKSGYFDYCSIQCVTQSEERNSKISRNHDYVADQEKIKKTNLKKYGVENYYESDDFKEKSKKIKLERYGDQYFNNVEKNKETCLEKYGVSSLMENFEFQNKIYKIKKEKYPNGIQNFGDFKSKAELEIIDFLNQFEIFESNRTVLDGLEIDGYCEKLNLGIEYCGLYWHSDRFKNNYYHYHKFQECKKRNIRLITIFEDEWIHRNQQVKQFLKATLGKFKERIYARNCKIIFPNKDISKVFFDKYHIQGNPTNIKHSIGLEYNNEIVGLVSFSIHHRNNREMTLNRLAFKDEIQIVGGASKLIKNGINFVRENITTWSDNRWSLGKIYEKNGFILDDYLKPDYSYVLNNNSFKRQNKQSSKKSIYNIPDDITEKKYFENKGMYRIWDCGKTRWKYYYNKKEKENNINGN